MPPSFRNRFRRRSPGPSNNRRNNSSSSGGGGLKSFIDRRSSSTYSQHHNNQKQPLATFDACVEACDALAASSLSQQNQRQLSGSGRETGAVCSYSKSEKEDNNSDHEDKSSTASVKDIIPDCSVLVSPDGALLFTHNHKTSTQDDKYPWTNVSTEDRDGVILEEEYESAVVCGNDLSLNGDTDANGFSARGWNHDAATAALKASSDVLTNLTTFVEELASVRKEESACVANAVAKLSDCRNLEKKHMNRMGPIVSSGTNLSVAMESLEKYYEHCAESSLERWRIACSERGYQTSMPVELQELNNERVLVEGMDQTSAQSTDLIQGILPKLRNASDKAKVRTYERQRALSNIRSQVSDAESILKKQKDWANSQHQRVAQEEANIDRLYAIKKMQQHEFYEEQRRKQDSAVLDQLEGETEKPLSSEVWEMVQGIANSEDFAHTGYSPRQTTRKPTVEEVLKSRFDESGRAVDPETQRQKIPHPPMSITRADVEKESEINDIKMVAAAADESVEDAAGKLLNIMSKSDTTLRSAALAAETCMLSEANSAYNTMRSLVALERATLEERLRRLEVVETAIEAVDVRKDIDNYIQADKAISGGRARTGEDDDGGIAAALAVLNSHSESSGNVADSPRKYRNVERPSYFEGWGEKGEGSDDDEEDDNDVNPEIFGDVINLLFGAADKQPPKSPDSPRRGKRERSASESSQSLKEEKVNKASKALEETSKRGQSFRKTVLYELNTQRSKDTEVKSKGNFEALCRIFNSFLSGCGSECTDVSNAKMLMILSQTFYMSNQEEGEEGMNDKSTDRKSRIYIKSKISHHEIWDDDGFWDQALYQCVSESLAKSGVLLNYAKASLPDGENRAARDPKSIKWHDLLPDEYSGAAAQVHSVVFAQLGTLSRKFDIRFTFSHSMNFIHKTHTLISRFILISRLYVRTRVRYTQSRQLCSATVYTISASPFTPYYPHSTLDKETQLN